MTASGSRRAAELDVAILRDVASLRAQVAEWRRAGESVALVPTMGALHAGHVSLVALGKRKARRVVMSIFVNPTQFAPAEDFSTYPRSFDADVAKFAAAEGDAVFAPDLEEMYKPGFATTIALNGPAAAGLEDRFRPTHFAGVATVVGKLLNQCRADVAVFGEKDYQQLKVVTRMAQDLDIATEILGAPTIREADGLALSSRNAYLSAAERSVAPVLQQALVGCAGAIRSGVDMAQALAAAHAALAESGFAIDYVEARHADDLSPILAYADAPIRLLAAARLGATRLIDNIAV